MNNLPNSFEQMIESKYIKKEDVIPDKLFTIAEFKRLNIAQEGDPPDYKWALQFEEEAKPLLLNSTNIQLLKLALGVNGPAEAVGRKIVAFNDPSVSFGGKLTGGVRLRAARVRQAEPVPAVKNVDQFDDDIPF
jgi:hypothetical protein